MSSQDPEDKTSNTPKLTKAADKKIGQILVDAGIITTEQLAFAIAEQTKLNAQGARKFKVGEILLFKQIVSLQQLHSALRTQSSKAELSRISTIASKQKDDDLTNKIKGLATGKNRTAQSNLKPKASSWSSIIDVFKKK